MPTIAASVEGSSIASCGRVVLPSGHTATFDASDQALVDQYVWRLVDSGTNLYAYGYLRGHAPRLGRVVIAMHRLFLDPPAELDVDHRNGNGLDNRRSNLRVATRSQNMANTFFRHNTSGFKGVSFHKQSGRWTASITVAQHKRHLGSFGNPLDAARAYNVAALAAWGEFAYLNEVD